MLFSGQQTTVGDKEQHNPIKDVVEDMEFITEPGFSLRYFTNSEVLWIICIRNQAE
jgi:hypothetical protein